MNTKKTEKAEQKTSIETKDTKSVKKALIQRKKRQKKIF